MSGKLRGSNVKWENSSEENDMYESRYKMRLRESLKDSHQPADAENEVVMETRKRGRGPSKRPCLNRNALMARENRLRKKAYLEKIENKLSFYQQENKNLVNIIKKQTIDIKRLSGEVAYLKSVLSNNTSITTLLKTINNGLQRITTQKRNLSYMNHDSEHTNASDAQRKCTCYTNVKENVLNSQNTNIFITNINNDSLTGHSTTEDLNNESYINSQRQFACKNSPGVGEVSSSFLDSDHTYTVSKSPLMVVKNNSQSEEASPTSLISEDNYMDNTEELDDLLPIDQADLPNADEKKDVDVVGIDFDQLSSFNMDMFEDLPKCDYMMNTVDSLHDTSNPFTAEEISQTLDNAGICLHVNSDKVSLEFCSICHLNSKSSGSD
ncbi:hypothetical protein K0M31_006065 [Melipona bicolor]|uniref:BZIP domain-containing protein n=1 Tax=Melipona bicolor TaxID=60889 RepID=A0AA40FTP7_9HYME|nr:hypothetical protein K0M31_006065 [Melipona bicolor]